MSASSPRTLVGALVQGLRGRDRTKLRDAAHYLRDTCAVLARFPSLNTRLAKSGSRALFGLTRHASRHELQRLVEQGFLRLEPGGRGAAYRPLPLLEADTK